MSVYLSSQKVIKDWIDYNDHMNVSYYLLIFDKYGADTLNNISVSYTHLTLPTMS